MWRVCKIKNVKFIELTIYNFNELKYNTIIKYEI